MNEVFVAGDCPVCPGFGAAVFVVALSGGPVFLACPACGCAWDRPPSSTVDQIESPARFAAGGFRLAVRGDIENAGVVTLIDRVERVGGIYDDFDGSDGFERTDAG